MAGDEGRDTMAAGEDRGLSLADKLNKLFRLKRTPEGGQPSSEDAAATIREAGGPTISATYLWQLRKGIKDNPTKRHLEALARYFGVPVTYFFDGEDARRIDDKLTMLEDLGRTGVYNLARNVAEAGGLSAERLGILEGMAEQLVQLELRSRGIAPAGGDQDREDGGEK